MGSGPVMLLSSQKGKKLKSVKLKSQKKKKCDFVQLLSADGMSASFFFLLTLLINDLSWSWSRCESASLEDQKPWQQF